MIFSKDLITNHQIDSLISLLNFMKYYLKFVEINLDELSEFFLAELNFILLFLCEVNSITLNIQGNLRK